MKILVTGANGYLGTGIVKELLDRGCDVIATDFKEDQIDARAKRIVCNLFEIDNPYDFFEKPDSLIHLAWRDGFKHDSDAHLNDLPKHYGFLKKFIDSGIRKVTVMGSMHEIGFFQGEINEDTPANPLSLYGISKDALRKSLELLNRKNTFHLQWIRGFYIVGNTERGCSIFSKLTNAEENGEKEFPFTTGDNKYDFISYEDFCRQVVAVVCQDEINGIINCCSGKAISLKNAVENFLVENHYNIKLKYGVFPDRPYDSKEVWGNTEKISQIMRLDS